MTGPVAVTQRGEADVKAAVPVAPRNVRAAGAALTPRPGR